MSYQPPTSDDEDELDSDHTFGGRDGIIFVVDTNKNMFDEDESNPSKFRTCLECIETTMLNTIINSDKDLLGIVFYNTKNSPKPSNSDDSDLDSNEIASNVPKNVSLFMNMATTSKEMIQRIKSLRDSDDLFDFETVYGYSDQQAKFSDIFWLCSKMFFRCGYKLQSKTIILFTDNDQPHPKDSNEFKQAFIYANDLRQQYIDITLVPMSEHFSGEPFFLELLCTILDQEPETFNFPKYDQSVEMCMSRIFRKDFRKRCIGHLKFHIGSGVQIGVAYYNLTRKSKYPKRLNLLRETNEAVTGKRIYVLGEYNEEMEIFDFSEQRRLLPSELRKYMEIGNEKIIFTNEEINSMKSMMEPGIRLIGFKPLSTLAIEHHLYPSGFLFYDESSIKGSAVVYRALWEKCLEKEKIAICVLTVRRKVLPKYVALVPQKQQVSSNGLVLRQNGFRVAYLPCVGHIRDLDVFEKEPTTKSTEPQSKFFEKIIKKLKFKYQPQQFENPSIKNIYAHIEAYAFNTDKEFEFEDSTLPDLVRQDQQISPFVDQITELFGTIEVNTKGTKRVGDATKGNSQKMPKNTEDCLDTNQMRDAAVNGTIKKLTVATLKSFCLQNGIKGYSKSTKDGLIEKIREFLEL